MSNRSKSSPQVHQIKAIFEGFRHGHARPAPANIRGSSYHADMSTDNLLQHAEDSEAALISHDPLPDAPDTIETVIDTSRSHARPALSAKPSWIGPLPRGPSAMSKRTHRVTITYGAPGLTPPVYITTSLSDPAWDVLEMRATKTPFGDLLFYIDFDAAEGEYQYKFRLGPGDWWVCDDSKPTIDDGLGNRNNLLFVQGDSAMSDHAKVDSVHTSSHPAKIGDKSLLHSEPKQESEADADAGASRNSSHSDIDTLSTRSEQIDVPAPTKIAKLSFAPVPAVDHDDEVAAEDDEEVPLLKHETTFPGRHVEPTVEIPYDSPAKSSTSGSSFEDIFYPEADANDPSLHHFPTHHEGIIDEIKRAHRQLPEDQTGEEMDSQPRARLPSLAEAFEEVLPGEQARSRAASANGSRWYDHSHTAAHHHAYGHKNLAHADKPESQTEVAAPANEQVASAVSESNEKKPAPFDDMQDALVGLSLAVVIAIVALLLYRSGLFALHDTIKDGGAALNG